MYKFIRAAKFFQQLKAVRILNLSGSMGTGKTLMSVALAYELLRQGRVTSAAFNFPVKFAGSPVPKNTVAVIDEAGTIFENRMAFKDKELNKQSAALTWRLRKLGSYFVVPSFIDVDKRFRVGVRCWRTMSFGNTLWIYHWEVGEESADERRQGINYWDGSFWLFGPSYFFNVFDTYFFPPPGLTAEFIRRLLFYPPQTVPADLDIPGI